MKKQTKAQRKFAHWVDTLPALDEVHLTSDSHAANSKYAHSDPDEYPATIGALFRARARNIGPRLYFVTRIVTVIAVLVASAWLFHLGDFLAEPFSHPDTDPDTLGGYAKGFGSFLLAAILWIGGFIIALGVAFYVIVRLVKSTSFSENVVEQNAFTSRIQWWGKARGSSLAEIARLINDRSVSLTHLSFYVHGGSVDPNPACNMLDSYTTVNAFADKLANVSGYNNAVYWYYDGTNLHVVVANMSNNLDIENAMRFWFPHADFNF